MLKEKLTPNETALYWNESTYSEELNKYIQTHLHAYSYFIFTPLLAGTTYFGVSYSQNQGILLSNLTNIPNFDISFLQELFKHLKAVVVLSEQEKYKLIKKELLGDTPYFVLSLGIPSRRSNLSFSHTKKENYGIVNPYLLADGSFATSKEIQLLLEYFIAHKRIRQNSSYKLVLLNWKHPLPLFGDSEIYIFNDLTLEQEDTLLANAVALCHVADEEVFPLLLLKGWQFKKAVIAKKQNALSTNLLKASSGGLFFENFNDFSGILDLFHSQPGLCQALGKNGNDFLIDHHSSMSTMEGLEKFLVSL
jgi:hypothetical protein